MTSKHTLNDGCLKSQHLILLITFVLYAAIKSQAMNAKLPSIQLEAISQLTRCAVYVSPITFPAIECRFPNTKLGLGPGIPSSLNRLSFRCLDLKSQKQYKYTRSKHQKKSITDKMMSLMTCLSWISAP